MKKGKKMQPKVTKPVVDVSSITASDVFKKLEALEKASKAGALKVVSPLGGVKWEPKKGEKLLGVYLGVSYKARSKVHSFACAQGGSVVQRTIDGAHTLNQQLAAVDQGTAVVVLFNGTAEIGGDREQRLFTVERA